MSPHTYHLIHLKPTKPIFEYFIHSHFFPGCLRRALTTTSHTKHADISVDDLIPILVFVIVKSGLTHWISTQHYLKNFIFTEFTDGSDKGVDSFLLTTLEAAILYIQTLNLTEFKRLSITPSDHVRRHFRTKSEFLDYLFGCIIAENELEIIKLLKTDKTVIIGVNANANANGCASSSCTSDDSDHSSDISFDAIIRNGLQSGNVIGVADDGIDDEVSDEQLDVLNRFPDARLNLVNGHGIGAIHIAAMHGSAKMLNLLIALGIDLQRRDDNNWTALHYAGARGHQNTLLLLLHAGCDINAITQDKCTVLHLSSLNGNGNCVKALLYYSDHAKVRCDRNAQTRAGDTAIHVAVKWGFIEIIETLLEYGVRLDIRNRAGHLPIDLAHNSHIESMLQTANAATFDWTDDDDQPTTSGEIFRGCYSTLTAEAALATDTAPFKQRTCNDKIVTAIKNNDNKLANHFLGIDNGDGDAADATASIDVCHPLCDCEKCKPITEYLAQKTTPTQLQRKYDGDVNEYSSTEGISPLHAAIQMKNIEMIRKLLELGAAVSRRTRAEQQTSVHLAVLTGSQEVLDIILNALDSNAVIVIEAQDERGDTALHLACRRGNEEAANALAQFRPNVRIVNGDSKDAMDIANEGHYANIVKTLKAIDCGHNESGGSR